MERFLNRFSPVRSVSESPQASDGLLDIVDDGIFDEELPQPLLSPSIPSTQPDSPHPDGFPDYSVWSATQFARFPQHIIHHNAAKERVWWWAHGYRLISQHEKPQVVWVCESCLLTTPHVRIQFKFVANTGKSIISHLDYNHNIKVRINRYYSGIY